MNANLNKAYPNVSLENFFSTPLAATNDAVFAAIQAEYTRQNEQIELIASENIVSKAVMQAQGTCLTNKYAEVIRVVVTTAVVSMLTALSRLLSNAPKCFFSVNTQTFNHTQALKPMAL